MIPNKCKMPDISDLTTPLLPALLAQALIGNKELSRKSSLYRNNFVRLVDKAVFEYQESRSTIIAQIEEMQRSTEEMVETGRVLHILNFTDHFENCINATARLLKLLDKIKNESRSPSISRLVRRLVEAYSKSIPDIRNAIEHMDEKIRGDEIVEGQPVMLSVGDDGDKATIASYHIKFNDLATTLRKLHAVAKQLLESGSN